VTEHLRDLRAATWVRHHARLWRWIAFDPPMRDAAARGSRARTVRCTFCACDLATVDDPFEGLFVAWRHRRSLRRRPA
jgi:hypothetical protein